MAEIGVASITILADGSKFTESLDKQIQPAVRSSTDKFGKALKVGLVAAAGVAVAGLAAVFKTGFDEALDASKGTAQLAAGIKSTGNAAKVTVKGMQDLAGSIQGYSGQTDDSIVSAEQLLLTFTNIKNNTPAKIFDQATVATANMAAKMGGDASTYAVQLGKALNDPVKGITALTRVGVSFTDGQKKSIEAMVKTGDTAGAQTVILQELNKEFGGAAKAAGESLPGQLARSKRAFEDVSQSVVEGIIPIITPALENISTVVTTKIVPAVGQFVQGFKDGTGAGGTFRDVLSTVVDVLKVVGGAILDTIGFFSKHQSALIALGVVVGGVLATMAAAWVVQKVQAGIALVSMLISTAGIVGGWIAMAAAAVAGAVVIAAQWLIAFWPVALVIAIVVGLVIVIAKNMDTIKKWIGLAWTWIKNITATIWNGIKDFFTSFWDKVKAIFTAAFEAIKKAITTYFNLYKTIIMAVWNALKTAIDVVWAAIKKSLTVVWDAIKSVVTTVFNAYKTIIMGVWNALKTAMAVVWNAIKGALVAVWNTIKTALTNAFNFYKTIITNAWNSVKNVTTSVWNGIKSFFSSIWSGIKNLFTSGVNAIATAWNRLEGIAKKPIHFVIATVLNGGLIKAFNFLSGHIGGPKIGNIPVPFAAGGVLPGYTPGRDVHQFFSPTGGALALSGGEAIMRPEFTKAVGGAAGVAQLNASAMRGGVLPFASGGVYGSHSYAGGGIIDWIKKQSANVWGWVTDRASSLYKNVTNPLAYLKSKMPKINGMGDLGDISNAAAGKLLTSAVAKINKLWGAFKSAFDSSGAGMGVGTIGLDMSAGPRWVRMYSWIMNHLGIPYLWGGTGPRYDCSGFTQAASRAGGVGIPRTARMQQAYARNVSGSSLHPGDLGFVGYPAHHVEMFMGSNRWAQAPHTGAYTRIDKGMNATGGYGRTFDQGGWLMPGKTTAINNTGKPERVLAPGEGATNITVNVDAKTLGDLKSVQDFIDMLGNVRINGRRTARSGTVRV